MFALCKVRIELYKNLKKIMNWNAIVPDNRELLETFQPVFLLFLLLFMLIIVFYFIKKVFKNWSMIKIIKKLFK